MELLNRYGLNGSSVINKQDFFHLCPALIQQVDNKVCMHGHTKRSRLDGEHRGTPLEGSYYTRSLLK